MGGREREWEVNSKFTCSSNIDIDVTATSNLPVNPRGTALTMGITSEERETCVNPICLAISPTTISCSVNLSY